MKLQAIIGAIEVLEQKRDYTEKGLTFEEYKYLDMLVEQAEMIIYGK